MPLRYLLKALLLPPGILFVLLILGWWLRRTRPRLAATFFRGRPRRIVADEPAGRRRRLPLVSWSRSLPCRNSSGRHWRSRRMPVVVLGNGRERNSPTWGSDTPTGLGLERLRLAARLAKESGLPILTSGGLHFDQPPSEASIMAQSLQDDFAVAVRWQEGLSRTTWENATMSAAILQPQGIKRVVLVTQAWHMPRARWSFEQAGFTVVGAPVGFLGVDNARPFGGWLPESRVFTQSGVLLNEAAGLLVYPWIYRKGQ